MPSRLSNIVAIIIAVVAAYYSNIVISYYSPYSSFVPKSVDLISATTRDILDLLENGTVTSAQLVSEYQRRIERDNRAGFWLNAILSTAPKDQVLQLAKQRDKERWQGKLRGSLHGVPFVVKVLRIEMPLCELCCNIKQDTMVSDPTLGMRTTYGAYALQDSIYPKQAFVLDKAQEAGAILIGKANLQVRSYCVFI